MRLALLFALVLLAGANAFVHHLSTPASSSSFFSPAPLELRRQSVSPLQLSIGGLKDASQLDSDKSVTILASGQELLASTFLETLPKNTCLILGTYAADFNAIEYAQRVSFYLPQLKAKNIENVCFVLNASPAACKEFTRLMSLPTDSVNVVSDSFGAIGRAFGCSRGWRPDDLTSPYVKLFGMLFGLGAVMTLPSVIGGYIGNPWTKQPWIEASLAANQFRGIWPDNALELDQNGAVITNKFTQLPIVGSWGRRPLELATLRLQNMLGISLKNWNDLKPTDQELERGLLTQLGGLIVFGESKEDVRYRWIDDGICDVCNFEAMLTKL